MVKFNTEYFFYDEFRDEFRFIKFEYEALDTYYFSELNTTGNRCYKGSYLLINCFIADNITKLLYK